MLGQLSRGSPTGSASPSTLPVSPLLDLLWDTCPVPPWLIKGQLSQGKLPFCPRSKASGPSRSRAELLDLSKCHPLDSPSVRVSPGRAWQVPDPGGLHGMGSQCWILQGEGTWFQTRLFRVTSHFPFLSCSGFTLTAENHYLALSQFASRLK